MLDIFSGKKRPTYSKQFHFRDVGSIGPADYFKREGKDGPRARSWGKVREGTKGGRGQKRDGKRRPRDSREKQNAETGRLAPWCLQTNEADAKRVQQKGRETTREGERGWRRSRGMGRRGKDRSSGGGRI